MTDQFPAVSTGSGAAVAHAQPILRFAAPLYPGGRHCLMCGSVTMGAVFPPAGSDPRWRWRLLGFGANPSRDGAAKDEPTAKGHLMAALSLTLAEARLDVRRG